MKGIGAVALWLGLILVVGFLGALVSGLLGTALLGLLYVLVHHWTIILLVLIVGFIALIVIANR